jgi:transposase
MNAPSDGQKLPPSLFSIARHDQIGDFSKNAAYLAMAGVADRVLRTFSALSAQWILVGRGVLRTLNEIPAQHPSAYPLSLRSDDVRGRGYAPKGKTPVVLANANRSKLSVISTVTNKGQMRWKVFSGALNTKIMIGFMKRLVHGRQKRVFLILDNLRVHHSKAVKKWLTENEEKIQVFNLPSYSPELNPDELLNAYLKQHVTKAAPPRNKIALTRTAIGVLHSIQKHPGRVQTYFGQKGVAYAA